LSALDEFEEANAIAAKACCVTRNGASLPKEPALKG